MILRHLKKYYNTVLRPTRQNAMEESTSLEEGKDQQNDVLNVSTTDENLSVTDYFSPENYKKHGHEVQICLHVLAMEVCGAAVIERSKV